MPSCRSKSVFQLNELRTRLRQFIGLAAPIDGQPGETAKCPTFGCDDELPGANQTNSVDYRIVGEEDCGTYIRRSIHYSDLEGGVITAFLLIPAQTQLHMPAVIVHHQHNGERHLGKSEVCGLVGDPLNAFGPALASDGIVVLAPDSICFEDRRRNNCSGTIPGDGDSDFMQHFFEMEYRLVKGDSLMRKVLHDAWLGISLLQSLPQVDSKRIGALGHSYGGNTVLFQMATDGRITFGCASGSACTFACKMQNRTGLEMALVLPGFCKEFELTDVVRAIAPANLLLVSADEDQYSLDADRIYDQCKSVFCVDSHHTAYNLHSVRYHGGHALTRERFDVIVRWMRETINSLPSSTSC